MAISDIGIKLSLQGVSSVQGGLSQVTSKLGDMDSATLKVGNALKGMGAALVAALGVGSIAAFAHMVQGTINATGAFNDLAIKTGASAAALMAFKSIGTTTETSAESIAAAMNKLSVNMSKAEAGGNGTAAALKALGINFKTFKALNPEDQMLAVAKAMGQFDDGAGKSAAAVALFGKKGADLLPFLKDLEDQADDVTANLTEQTKALKANQAAMADAYGDNLTEIRRNADGWKKELSLGLLPAFYEATEAIKKMNEGTGGLKSVIGNLAKDGTLAEWARGAMTALSYLLDVAQGLFSLIPMLGKAIAAVAAAAVTMFDSLRAAMERANDTTLSVNDRLSGAWKEMKTGFTSVADIGASAAGDISAIWNQKLIGQTFRDTMAGLKGIQAGAKEVKPALDFTDTSDANAEALKRQQEAVAKLLESYGKMADATALKIAATQTEMDTGKKLTDAEREYVKVMIDVRDGKITLEALENSNTLAKLRANIASADAIEKAREEQRAKDDLNKTLASVAAATNKYELALFAETDAMRKANVELREQNEKAGLSERQIVAREAAILRSRATELEWDAAMQGGNGQLSEQARLLRERAALLEQGVVVQEAKAAADEWKKTTDSINGGLTDALMRAFESGKGFFDAFKSTLVNAFKSMVLQPTIKMILAPISGALGSLFSGNAMAGTGAGGIGGVLSSLGNLFNGSTIGNSIGGAFNSFATSGLGSSLGLSAPIDFGTGFAANVASPMSGMIGSGLGMLGNGFAGYGISKALSGGYSAGSWVNSVAGIASAIPGIGPIAGVIGGLVNRAFGMKAKELKDTGITGSFTAGGTNAQQYQDWFQKGGWLRSNKSGTDLSALGSQTSDALKAGAFGVLASSRAWAQALQLPADALASVTTQFKVKLTGKADADQAEISRLFERYSDDLAGTYQAQLRPFQRAGETLGATLQRLAGLQQFSTAINDFGGVFSRVAGLSVDAKEQLLGFAGGIEALLGKTRAFVGSYYSEAEQAGLAARAVQQQLQAIGINTPLTNRADFRALVEATDVSNEQGRQRLAQLLDIATAFAPVGQYLEAQGGTLASVANQAPATAVLQSLLSGPGSAQQATVDGLTELNATTAAAGDATVSTLERLIDRVAQLEVTGPARYWNFDQTSALLDDGRRRDEALVAEIRALRTEVTNLRAEARATAENTGKTQRLMQRMTRDGESMAVTDVTPA